MERRAPVPVEVLLSQREWVRSLARRLTADDAAADDLAQEAWVDALRSPPARDAGIRGWFATLLRRRARDAWRGASRRE
ncbi:MAG: RNA polymerase subunit sigma, partial [Planctomycetes bacterium]|nr:RNA polymerase subunit sigma [Planctomycetota bacterium]